MIKRGEYEGFIVEILENLDYFEESIRIVRRLGEEKYAVLCEDQIWRTHEKGNAVPRFIWNANSDMLEALCQALKSAGYGKKMVESKPEPPKPEVRASELVEIIGNLSRAIDNIMAPEPDVRLEVKK